MKAEGIKSPFNLLVVVAALGYFVDIYDLILFNVVKKESLEALGLGGVDYESNEIFLFNWQMIGMLTGGILWGVLGDKRGRLSVLFGSILMYSLANIANAFVTDMTSYAIVRFLAGLGLAGELGAGITLVVETMSKETRGYGTMLIVTFGALGAVFASLVGSEGAIVAGFVNDIFGTSFMGWQMAYIVGGVLGLLLLFLRIGTIESGMYTRLETSSHKRGDFSILFKSRKLFWRYVSCIIIGLPIWYIVGILIALCVGLTKEMGIIGAVTGTAIMYTYIGLSVGDLMSGLISQLFKSRKKVVIGYLIASSLLIYLFLFPFTTSLTFFYFMCFLLGTAAGYWALFVTIASEQFGTNIRSTVTNTVPNFVRGSVVPVTLLYKQLEPVFLASGTAKIYSASVVGIICLILAFIGIFSIKDSFSRDLNYIEEC
ncbi:MAG: MFS transporter [Bacteroidetes bacterium]|nr:MAG: MFS transporter [Bacteroidota bacterium]REK06959.1 MAG: MFS transporter [Bacteroidota bacterium]REK33693.1 MAG: MFS transporter [Bacteroidota bacterium]REK47230.1 MAG: MFS transporter [Bacteroidota bacterium]